MSTILLINGPNLNLLGTREPEIYGKTSLEDIEKKLKSSAEDAGHRLECLQSNAEHEIIDAVQNASVKKIDVIIINPGPLTHTSIALRDAFLSTKIPFIEIHISNIFEREEFRKNSYLSDISIGCIIGCGVGGYGLAMRRAKNFLRDR
tara:strand:- start:621 stop:1064 length:444 start_codon:yes stop_codon:yes gene_type:complete